MESIYFPLNPKIFNSNIIECKGRGLYPSRQSGIYLIIYHMNYMSRQHVQHGLLGLHCSLSLNIYTNDKTKDLRTNLSFFLTFAFSLSWVSSLFLNYVYGWFHKLESL